MINIVKNECKTVPPLNELIVLLFGQPGAGKTKLCDGIPNALFIATEPGHEFTKSDVVNCHSWDTFIEIVKYLKELQAEGKLTYESYVIDIVDNLSNFCRDYICKQKKLAYPPANDFGKTWAEITQMWKHGLTALCGLGNVIFISHCTTRQIEVENEDGIKTELDQYVPTFSGSKAAQFLDGIVNAQGYMTTDKSGRHIITFKKTAAIGAKDRTDILSRYSAIDIDWASRKTSWEALNDAYLVACEKLNFKVESRRAKK